jgi:hypothetical protein
MADINWWTVFSTLGGTIVGSAISVTTSYLLQRKSLRSAKVQRDDDRFEVRKALGYSVLHKMINITSELHNVGRAVMESLEEAEKTGLDGGALFQIVKPIVPIAEKITFSSEEMALVLSIDTNLFNQIGPMDRLHNSTVALVDLYGTRRTLVMERFGATMQGSIGTTEMTEEQKRWVEPRGVELNSLVAAILQQSEEGGKAAWTALELLHAVLVKEFKLTRKLERVV